MKKLLLILVFIMGTSYYAGAETMDKLADIEIIVGDNMNIPRANNILATIKSNTINGTKTINPISKAVFNSLKI